VIFVILYIYPEAQNKSNLYLSPKWHFFSFLFMCTHQHKFCDRWSSWERRKKKILVKIIYFSHVTFKLFVFSFLKKRLFVFYLVVILKKKNHFIDPMLLSVSLTQVKLVK